MYMTGYVLHILRTDDFVRQAEKTAWRIGLIRNGEGISQSNCVDRERQTANPVAAAVDEFCWGRPSILISLGLIAHFVLSRTLQNKPFAIMLSWASPFSGRAVNGGAQVPPLLAELI
jgi:hypothetical protein